MVLNILIFSRFLLFLFCLLVFVAQWSDSACGTSCHYYWVCWLVQLVFVIIHRLALFSASTLERVPNETNLYFAPRITIGKYHPCLCHCTKVWSVVWLLLSPKRKEKKFSPWIDYSCSSDIEYVLKTSSNCSGKIQSSGLDYSEVRLQCRLQIKVGFCENCETCLSCQGARQT